MSKIDGKKILGIDTSSDVLVVFLANGNKLLWQENLEGKLKHVEKILPLIDEGLKKLSWRMPEIEIIATGIGPGSFTGLRVGLATVKGFSVGTNKKIVSFSSLDIIAQNIKINSEIAVILDAKRESLYISQYKRVNEVFIITQKPSIITINDFKLQLEKRITPIILCGDALEKYKDDLLLEFKNIVNISDEKNWRPNALSLFEVSKRLIIAEQYIKIEELNALYLRKSYAEENLKQKG